MVSGSFTVSLVSFLLLWSDVIKLVMFLDLYMSPSQSKTCTTCFFLIVCSFPLSLHFTVEVKQSVTL